MKNSRRTLAFALCAVLAACGDDATEPQGPQTLVLSFEGLEPLASGFHYEGWALIDGQPVPTGKFNVNASGSLVSLQGTPIQGGAFETGVDLGEAEAIVITVEPNGDTDAIPANSKVLAGPVTAGSAMLTVGAPQALGTDFTSAAGTYILATPTDDDMSNEASGVWFVSLESGSPMAGLSLPTLPAGWVYEGWAVIDGRPVTTGRFTSAAGADQAAPFSGPKSGPPFPGEDYLINAPAGLTFPTNLAGGMAVISVEPEPDDSPAPFTLKPLLQPIPSSVQVHTTYMISNNAFGLARGTATIR